MANNPDAYPLPPAEAIDYTNPDEVESYSLYLIKLYEREGAFKSPGKLTPLMRSIETELRTWCGKVKYLLTESPLPAVAALIPAYDFPYRIAHRQSPSGEFMRKVRIGAVQRWAKGEKTISSTTIAKILRNEIYGSDFAKLDNKYGLYYFDLIDQWARELQRSGTFAGIKQSETYARLKIIMGENLFGEYGSAGADTDKQRWAQTHLLSSLTALDTSTLRAYIEFAMAYSEMRHLPHNEYLANYITLFTELNARKDINPYLRSALTIDLALKHPTPTNTPTEMNLLS